MKTSGAEKWAAEEATLKVAGVTTVVNDLKVKFVGERDSDQVIAEAINQALRWNVWIPKEQVKAGVINNIVVEPLATAKDIKSQIRKAIHRYAERDAERIEVLVKEGEVKLSGKVQSRGERSEAEVAAWHTPGVKSVRNDISVSY